MSEIPSLENKEILVVEDDDMNYMYLQQIFKLTKGIISRVKTGTGAVEAARKNKFDIILMDIQLPDMNGNDATRQIRKTDKKTPIIAQTASRTPDETDKSILAGCSDVLVKPFTMEDLIKILQKYLS